MNKSDAINLLVDTTVKEFCKPDNREFLIEIVRNGFPGFSKMSDTRLEKELVFWGIKDCLAGDDTPDLDDSYVGDEFTTTAIRFEE